MKNKKITVGILFGMFLLIMGIMTFVSAMIYGKELPRVETAKLTYDYLTQTISGEGETMGGNELPVSVPVGLMVKEVCVREGEQVEQGSPLFYVDEEDLQERITQLTEELQIMQFQMSNLYAGKNYMNREWEVAKSRADILYNEACTEGEKDLLAALEKWELAVKELSEFPNKDAYVNQAVSESAQIKRVQNSLAQEKQSISGNTSQAENELNLSVSEVKIQAGKEWEEKRKNLEQKVSETLKNYEDALSGVSKSLRQAQWDKEDAGAALKQDSSGQIMEIEIAQKKRELQKLQDFQASGCTVKSSEKGQITGIFVTPGTRTSDQAGILYRSEGKEIAFFAVLSGEDTKKLSVGDKLSLTFFQNGNEKGEAVIRTIEHKSGEKEERIYATVSGDGAEIGQYADFSITKSPKQKEWLIPNEAVRFDGKQYYVYVLRSTENFLGEELTLRKQIVEVGDKNKKNTVITGTGLTEEEEVVIRSDKEIKEESVVRRKIE